LKRVCMTRQNSNLSFFGDPDVARLRQTQWQTAPAAVQDDTHRRHAERDGCNGQENLIRRARRVAAAKKQVAYLVGAVALDRMGGGQSNTASTRFRRHFCMTGP